MAVTHDYDDDTALDDARDAVLDDEAARLADMDPDDAYDERMSCRRPTNDCGCRTCGG